MKAGFWQIPALAAFFATCLAPAPARATESAWVSADYAQVRLIAGAEKAGLEVRLAPGWHAYWRMPGDGGLAPQMDWGRSRNLARVDVSWPVPRRYEDAGLQSFGYQDHFILPLAARGEDPGADIALALDLNMMVCEKICVPQVFSGVALTLPAGGKAGKHDARLAAVPLPHAGDTEALRIESLVVGPDALVARVFSANGFAALDVFVEAGENYVTAPPQITPDEKNPGYAMVRVAAPEAVGNLFTEVSGETLTVTVTDGRTAIERQFAL